MKANRQKTATLCVVVEITDRTMQIEEVARLFCERGYSSVVVSEHTHSSGRVKKAFFRPELREIGSGIYPIPIKRVRQQWPRPILKLERLWGCLPSTILSF